MTVVRVRRWLAVAVVVAVLVGCTATAEEPTAEPAVPTVAAEGTTDVPVTDQWSVQVPAAAAPAGTEIFIDTVDGAADGLWDLEGVSLLAAADVALESGRPAVPVTFTYRLEEPLPAGEVLFLADDTATAEEVLAAAAGDSPPSAAHVRVAELNADRTVATVTTDHLSFKSWLRVAADAVTNTIGKVFDQRTDPPSCTSPPPAWMTEEPTFLDDINGPLLVCVGRDPSSPEDSVVKVVNNRGGAILVSSPVTPKWAWQPLLFDGGAVVDWATNLTSRVLPVFAVPEAEQSRTWLLFPGSEVHIGFTQDMVTDAGPLTVRGRMPALGAAYGAALSATGLVMSLKDRNESLSKAATMLSLALLVGCVQTSSASTDGTAAGVGELTLELVGCVVSNPQAVFDVLEANVPAQAWNRMRGDVTRLATSAKHRGGPLLAIGQATFVLTDLATTMALGEGAWTVTLWPPLPPRAAGSVALGLGGSLGDLAVFEDADRSLTYLRAELGAPDDDSGWVTPTMCGPLGNSGALWRLVRWGDLEVMFLDQPQPQPDGSTTDAPVEYLAGWSYLQPAAGPVRPVLATAEGLTLGSSRQDVLDVYGDQASEVGVFGGSAVGALGVSFGDFSNLVVEFDTGGDVVAMSSGQGCN
ncbi:MULTISPECIES: hypothetical protein [unclassified Modestobacter]|uniref:hypothetical protein n=1 Tax=unclassified Modestobacter TaxID=2643866 RepID=UPI0022AA8B6D|nr:MULTISPECIES: hypothetical protein [unclassified Modestobacter]MCZ2826016.1 hypothetical protein [Modestobacter sp. VKM Ac-2981]MCZ2852919.1 hypothetical protein [Modestobacter sp. VKM Ac-2982]